MVTFSLKLGLLVALAALLTGTGAQILSPGGCPKVSVVDDFDVTKYTGVWFENRKYFAIFEIGGKCITANYTALEDNVVRVVNKQYNQITSSWNTIEGTATFAGPANEAKLVVKFPSSPFPAPYWVLGTDYTSYSVVFSCSDIYNLFNGQTMWILTRDQNPSQEVISKALQVIESNNLSVDQLKLTDQTNCD